MVCEPWQDGWLERRLCSSEAVDRGKSAKEKMKNGVCGHPVFFI